MTIPIFSHDFIPRYTGVVNRGKWPKFWGHSTVFSTINRSTFHVPNPRYTWAPRSSMIGAVPYRSLNNNLRINDEIIDMKEENQVIKFEEINFAQVVHFRLNKMEDCRMLSITSFQEWKRLTKPNFSVIGNANFSCSASPLSSTKIADHLVDSFLLGIFSSSWAS